MRCIRPAVRVAVLAALTLAACSDPPTGGEVSIPGSVTTTLVSPSGNEGSAIFEVVDGVVSSVEALEDDVAVYLVGTTPQRVVVLRRVPGVIAARLVVGDVQKVELRAVEVGGPEDELRPNLDAYSVRLRTEEAS